MNDELILVDSEEKEEYLPAPSQLSLIKISKDEVAEVIRPEANLEKFQSFLFPHPKAKNLEEKRSFTFDVKLPDGRDVEASVTVTPAKGDSSTTSRSYDVYLALLAIWDERGLPEEPFQTSIREIIKSMKIPMKGDSYGVVEKELDRLFSTTFKWRFSYQDEDKFQSVSNQNILDVYDYTTFQDRADQSDKFDKVLVIRLSQRIRENHRRKRTNPILWSERKKITSPIAKILYSRLDTFLFKRTTYERRALHLVDDLFVTKDRYKYLSQRKVWLEKLQSQLDGRWLSTQRKLQVTIEPTSDGKDVKLVCRSRNVKEIVAYNNLPIVNKNKAHISHLIDLIDETVGGKDENYKLYEVFSQYYSEQMILRALGEYKENLAYLKGKDTGAKRKLFTVTMHRIAHETGRGWIKKCSDNCKYRKSNRFL